MSGILSGPEIIRQVREGFIEIDPFDERMVNPASVDLRLGPTVTMYGPSHGGKRQLDAKLNHVTNTWDFNVLLLEPGQLYLMHTVERVCTHRLVPVLDGKSSIGRLGICVHLTAGYGDPGFNGQYTLEVTTVYPVRVYAGMRFCQMRFHSLEGEVRHYNGNYTGDAAVGPVASRSWKQFG